MKSLCYLLTLWLVLCCHAHAQTTTATPGLSTTLSAPGSDQAKANPAVCSPLAMSKLTEAQQIAAMEGPLNEALTAIDSAKIEFSSPTLASGKISYVTITPNFADNMARVCIIGYFYLGGDQNAKQATEPLVVDHIEIIKQTNPNDSAQPITGTRIFFRAPNPHHLSDSKKDIYWKFWSEHEKTTLKFAAFDYDPDTGVRGKPYFGRSIPVKISHQNASIFAAQLFGLSCYLIAAFTISIHTRGQNIIPAANTGRSRLRLRAMLRRLSPWYIAGSSGHASLSQLQMLLFTLIVATLLFYQWIRTGLLQELSTDLLYLIGISTIGAGGAQVTSSLKKNLDPAVYDYLQRLGWFTAPIGGAHSNAVPSQLLLTNGRFDIYKFQMLVFTFVIAGYVIMAGADQLGNIQISATLLSLMGMSQGVYIGGQITSDNVTPFQDQLRGMQMLQAKYDAAAGNPAAQAELVLRFEMAATQAAEMFHSMFNRDIPPFMLTLSNLPQSDNVEGETGSALAKESTPAA